jgi:hypothetical protein
MFALLKVASDTIAYVIGPTRLYDRPEVRFLNPGDHVWNELDLAIRQLRMQGNMVDFQGQKSNGGIYKVDIRGGLLAGTQQVPGARYRILKDGVRATLLEQMGGLNKSAAERWAQRVSPQRNKMKKALGLKPDQDVSEAGSPGRVANKLRERFGEDEASSMVNFAANLNKKDEHLQGMQSHIRRT